MEHTLMLGSLGLGGAGWLFLLILLLSRPRFVAPVEETPVPAVRVRPDFVWLALSLPILIWLATLPVQAPFSSGQGFGRGFLLGGLFAGFNILVLFNALNRQGKSPSSLAAISLFSALIVTSVPLLWMRSAVIEALLGGALGWVVVSLIWLLGINSSRPQSQHDSPTDRSELLATLILNGAAFAAILLAAAALGVYRDFVEADVARGTYSALATTLASGVALTALFSAALNASASPRRSENSPPSPFTSISTPITTALALSVPLGIGYLLSTRFLDDLAVFGVVAVGLMLGGLLWVIVRDDALQNNGTATPRPPIASILVALCGFMVAYQLLQGFGVGLMLLAAWPVSLLALPNSLDAADSQTGDKSSQVAQTLSILGAFIAILLLSRLFGTRFRADLRGASLDDQFAIFGFLAGAVLPGLLASLWFERRGSASRSLWRLFPTSNSLPRAFCLGVGALLLLGAVIALWGVKIVPTFLIGLALATVGLHGLTLNRISWSMNALFALSLALTACVWTQRFLPLAEVSRLQRLQWLSWSVGGVILLILIVDYGARLIARLKRPATKGVAS